MTAPTLVRAGTDEWLAARRDVLTAGDVPIVLGLSPYRCEAQLAAEKLGAEQPEPSMRMRLGLALEPFIAAEYTRVTGQRVRRVGRLIRHRTLEWAAATPDYEAIGRRLDVEIKWSTARNRWADGLPQDVEAQVRWQLGVMGFPEAEVAALVGDELRLFPVTHDEATFAGLVDIMADFRRRLAEGGPFADNSESVRARYPQDDGTELVADNDVAEAVRALIATRTSRRAMEANEERLEVAIQQRMGEASLMRGDGWHVTWKRTKDRVETDYRSLAEGLLRQLPEPERQTLVGIYQTVRPGFRPFRVTQGGLDD